MEELNTYISHTDYSGIKNFFLEKGIFHYARVDSSGKEQIVGYSFENGLHFGFRVANELFMYYKRLLALYCESPKQRYISLMKQCPKLKEKVPLKEIASFLGTSPETISHIKKKITF